MSFVDWKQVRSVALGRVIGHIVGTLFIAVCIILRFGPPQWAAYLMSGLPPIFTPEVARAAFLFFGTITLAWLIGSDLVAWRRRRQSAVRTPSPPLAATIARSTARPETKSRADTQYYLGAAARRAYEGIEEENIGKLVDDALPTPQRRLSYLVQSFLTNRVPIYGVRAPSSIARLIRDDDRDSLTWISQTHNLRFLTEKEPTYLFCYLLESDIQAHILKLKGMTEAEFRLNAHDADEALVAARTAAVASSNQLAALYLPATPVLEASHPAQIELEVGEAGEFSATVGRTNVYTHQRELRLRIKNLHPRFSLKACKVQLMNIEPQSANVGPWVMRDGMTLAGGDHTYIPLASYTERDDGQTHVRGATFFVLIVKDRASPSLAADSQHILTIRATALEAAYAEIQCLLWVGRNYRLHIHKFCDGITVAPDSRITLKEAAQIVYDETRHGVVADIARSTNVYADDDPLRAFAGIVVSRVPKLYARLYKSTVEDEFATQADSRLLISADLTSASAAGDRNARYNEIRIRRGDLVHPICYLMRLNEDIP